MVQRDMVGSDGHERTGEQRRNGSSGLESKRWQRKQTSSRCRQLLRAVLKRVSLSRRGWMMIESMYADREYADELKP